jgi:hypothetical protein
MPSTSYFRWVIALTVGLTFFGLQQSSQQLSLYNPIPFESYLSFTSDTNNSTTIHTKTDELTSLRPDAGLQFKWKEGRNYSSHPITAAESRYLHRQKQQLPAKYSNITTAVCHPTLFGKVTIPKIFSWVSYYRLLGVDHIFFWYRPYIAQRPYFDELKALPYVTMTEYNGTAHHREYHGQAHVEHECLSQAQFAANYTWAFPIDIDEYLWFNSNEPIYEFLYRLRDLHYVSIGKFMYPHRHAVALERNDSGFCLDRYAFTAGPHCYQYPILNVYGSCPTWRGRSKVLVKPSHHDKVDIHGYDDHHYRPGGTHLLSADAHLKGKLLLIYMFMLIYVYADIHADILNLIKEWPRYLVNVINTTVRPDRTTFYVSRANEVDIHNVMESYAKTEDGLVPFWYDDGLHDWFRFVAQGCPRDNQSISQH